jgi:N-acetyl-anhydromuramyl-L-alanine amidase AmpD
MAGIIQSESTHGLPKLFWLPSPNFYARKPDVDLIVVHDTEGGYQGAIATFLDHAPGHNHVSAHLVLKEDGAEVTQMVAFGHEAWHVVAFNDRTIGLEMAGFAAKGFGAPELQAMARVVAYLLHRFNLPIAWAQHGVGTGFCRHFDLGKAGGGHSDPTTDLMVWSHFVDLVKVEAAQGGWPVVPWGRN